MNKIINKLILTILKFKGKKIIQRFDNICENANIISEQTLMKIIRDNQNTEYGKKYNFDKIKCIDDYKKMVPFSFYDDYAPYIERMINNNERNLISVYKPEQYAITSGSMGVPRKIPVSKNGIKNYNDYALAKFVYLAQEYCKKNYGKDIPFGKIFVTLEVKDRKDKKGQPVGAVSAAAVKAAKKILKYMFTSPVCVMFPTEQTDMKYLKLLFALSERDVIAFISTFSTILADLMAYLENNWQDLVNDISTGTINNNINLSKELRAKLEKELKPDPERAKELQKEFEKGFDIPIVPRIWKNITWIDAIGGGDFTSYTKKLKLYTGDIPIDYSLYGASEGFMGIARNMNDNTYTLIPDSGFYEFIPADNDDTNVTYNINQLEENKDYEIVITNFSGFYRYKIKDVLRFKGYYHKSPQFEFRYRKQLLVSIEGEKTCETMLAYAIDEFEKRYNLQIPEYSLYADTSGNTGKYVLFMEAKSKIIYDKIQEYRDFLDEKLGVANPYYGALVSRGILAPMEIIFVQQHTYALYRDMQILKGVSPNQIKPVKVIDTPEKKQFFFSLKEL